MKTYIYQEAMLRERREDGPPLMLMIINRTKLKFQFHAKVFGNVCLVGLVTSLLTTVRRKLLRSLQRKTVENQVSGKRYLAFCVVSGFVKITLKKTRHVTGRGPSRPEMK
ncbi:uncharacterized protein LOC144744708 isoform X1 [Ciona intestinalis]